jgi:hypothetical protein
MIQGDLFRSMVVWSKTSSIGPTTPVGRFAITRAANGATGLSGRRNEWSSSALELRGKRSFLLLHCNKKPSVNE